MLDLAGRHPFVACTAFALEWLEQIAKFDLVAAETLVDSSLPQLPFADFFPAPVDFTYCHPNVTTGWWTIILAVLSADQLAMDFDIPRTGQFSRRLTASFIVTRTGTMLAFAFDGVVHT